jgi:hypothetical protein
MKMNISRRNFLRIAGGAVASAAVGVARKTWRQKMVEKTEAAVKRNREFVQWYRLNGCTITLPEGYTFEGTVHDELIFRAPPHNGRNYHDVDWAKLVDVKWGEVKMECSFEPMEN